MNRRELIKEIMKYPEYSRPSKYSGFKSFDVPELEKILKMLKDIYKR